VIDLATDAQPSQLLARLHPQISQIASTNFPHPSNWVSQIASTNLPDPTIGSRQFLLSTIAVAEVSGSHFCNLKFASAIQ